MGEVSVDCGEVEEILTPEDIVKLNRLVTEPGSFEEEVSLGEEEPVQIEVGHSPELEFSREEDYHEVGNEGILETLVYTKLPHICGENSDALWLSSIIMYHIAENQAFYEGNKRTAYLSGALFFVKAQLIQRDQAVYPILDKALTRKLSRAATRRIDQEDLYGYLLEALGGELEKISSMQ